MLTKAELELYTSSRKNCIEENSIRSGALTFPSLDFTDLLKQWSA